MIINEPNIVIWEKRCYIESHTVQKSLGTRLNPDGRRQGEYKPKKRRQTTELEKNTGNILDAIA